MTDHNEPKEIKARKSTHKPSQKEHLQQLHAEYESFLKQGSEAEILGDQKKDSSQVFTKTLTNMISPSISGVAFKFVPVALLSVFISLFLCPQFGLSPYKMEPEFLSHLLHQNMFICGLYCGLVLYIALHSGAYLFFNHYERLQFKRQLSYLPFTLAAGIWGALMMSSSSHYSGDLKYNSGWILAVVLGLAYSLYRGKQAQNMAGAFEKHKDL